MIKDKYSQFKNSKKQEIQREQSEPDPHRIKNILRHAPREPAKNHNASTAAIILPERLQILSRRFQKDKNEFFYYLDALSLEKVDSTGLVINNPDLIPGMTNRMGNFALLKGQRAVVQMHSYGDLEYTIFKAKQKGRQIYRFMPFINQSIEFVYTPFLHQNYEFYQPRPLQKYLQDKRLQFSKQIEIGIISEIKKHSLVLFSKLNYFQIFKSLQPQTYLPSEPYYPPQFMELAAFVKASLALIDPSLGPQQQVPTGPAKIRSKNRTVVCEQAPMQEIVQKLYFSTANDYDNYLNFRKNQFKREKIFYKDLQMNTNLRNIIPTTKIYLIQLVKQIQQLNLLAKNAYNDSNLLSMRLIQKILSRKADQFVRVLMEHSLSDVLLTYQFENVPEKLLQFISKSLTYKKDLWDIATDTLQKYPYIRVLVELPQSVSGYQANNLKQILFTLVQLVNIYRQKILQAEKYQSYTKPKPKQSRNIQKY